MRLSVLGPLAIEGSEGEIRLTSRTQRSILAYLTVHAGHILTPEQILEAVWAEDVPSGGRKTLAYHISKLRESIGAQAGDASVISTIPGGYSLQVQADQLDSLTFDALHSEALAIQESDPIRAADIAASALDLWSGPEPYADLRYEDYLQAEIQRLLDKKLACAELFHRGQLMSGSTQAVIQAIPQLLEQAPFNEELHRLHIEALTAAGRRIDALRHYDAYVDMLREETGNTPQAELQAVATRLVEDEEPRPLLRGSNLPASITPLIGRQLDLDRLSEMIREHRYVDVLGPGGIGKSRLAVEAVRELTAADDSVGWFIDLTRTHDSVTGAVADALGVKDRPGEDLLDVVCRAVGLIHATFLFDNCEAYVSEVSSVAQDVLRNCPNSRVVTTSRFVTDATSAAAFRLSPMSSASSSDDGPRLFLTRAAAVGARLDEADEVTATAIVRQLDGMPLAIELAASHLGSRSIDDLHESLVEGGVRAFDEFLALSGNGPLWQMLRDSFELLEEQDQQHLRYISTFSGEFTASDAGDLITIPRRTAEAGLQRLSHRSLVVARPGVTPTRYVLLDTIREFVADVNSADGFDQEASERHIQWCEELTRECRRDLLNDHEVLGFVADRLANIRSAIDHLDQRNDVERQARLVCRLDLFWVISGRAAEGLRHLEKAMGGELSPRTEAIAFSSAALLASIDRSYDLAETWFERSLALGEHAPWVVPMVFANRARSRTAQAFSGRVADRGSVLAQAGEDFDAALQFFEATDLTAGLAITLPFAAWHATLIGEPQLADSRCERTITIGEEHGFGWPVAIALAIRGLLRLSQRAAPDAVPDLKEAEAGFEAWGDRYSMQITESLHAAAQILLDDLEAAVQAITHALSIMETQGSREWEAMTTAIALAVMQRVDGVTSVRFACHEWLDTNHQGWRQLIDTIGLHVVAERSTPEDIVEISASQMARDCRLALEHYAEEGMAEEPASGLRVSPDQRASEPG